MRLALAGALLLAAALSAAPTDSPSSNQDLTGYWNLPYVPNMALGHEENVPYTSVGQAAFKDHDSKDDPTGFCLKPGVPRIMGSPYPMQIVQTPTQVLFLFEYMNLWRAIYLDGRPHHKGIETSFMGDSIGHWEDDTLVIDTTALNDRTWLDTAGHQHSDKLHVIEKLRRTGPGSIAYQITVDDPVMYDKPWISNRVLTPLKATPGLPDLLEYECGENNKDLQHLRSNKPAK